MFADCRWKQLLLNLAVSCSELNFGIISGAIIFQSSGWTMNGGIRARGRGGWSSSGFEPDSIDFSSDVSESPDTEPEDEDSDDDASRLVSICSV